MLRLAPESMDGFYPLGSRELNDPLPEAWYNPGDFRSGHRAVELRYCGYHVERRIQVFT